MREVEGFDLDEIGLDENADRTVGELTVVESEYGDIFPVVRAYKSH